MTTSVASGRTLRMSPDERGKLDITAVMPLRMPYSVPPSPSGGLQMHQPNASRSAELVQRPTAGAVGLYKPPGGGGDALVQEMPGPGTVAPTGGLQSPTAFGPIEMTPMRKSRPAPTARSKRSMALSLMSVR